MQLHFRRGKPNSEGMEQHNRIEVTGLPFDHIPRRGHYSSNNNLVAYTDKKTGLTFLVARDVTEDTLRQTGYGTNGNAWVMFSQRSHLILDELRGNRDRVSEEVRIREMQRMYGTDEDRLWYFPD